MGSGKKDICARVRKQKVDKSAILRDIRLADNYYDYLHDETDDTKDDDTPIPPNPAANYDDVSSGDDNGEDSGEEDDDNEPDKWFFICFIFNVVIYNVSWRFVASGLI